MLVDLKAILTSFDPSDTSPKTPHGLTNFHREIAMIEDVFSALTNLVAKYGKAGSKAPLLQVGRFTTAQDLDLKQKWTWAKDDLKQPRSWGRC